MACSGKTRDAAANDGHTRHGGSPHHGWVCESMEEIGRDRGVYILERDEMRGAMCGVLPRAVRAERRKTPTLMVPWTARAASTRRTSAVGSARGRGRLHASITLIDVPAKIRYHSLQCKLVVAVDVPQLQLCALAPCQEQQCTIWFRIFRNNAVLAASDAQSGNRAVSSGLICELSRRLGTVRAGKCWMLPCICSNVRHVGRNVHRRDSSN
jgi:hypothetical protein